jgi:hypothetical protein
MVLLEIMLWSVLETALVLAVASAASGAKKGVAGCALVFAVPTSLLYNFIVFYFLQPVQEGFLFGQGWTVFAAVVYVGIAGLLATAADDKESNTGSALVVLAVAALLLEVTLWTGNGLAVTFGAGNAQNFASLANIEVASVEDKLPETDTHNIVLVTPDIAQYLGQQALNSAGNNLGSLFLIQPGEWVRQSIKGHLYYAAPLEYANPLSQFGILSQKIEASPGYVLVDAENPNADARIVSSLPLRYLPGAAFQQNLYRHVYQHGYTMIDKPSFEVDEEFRPHFTAAVLAPKFGVAGTMVKKILVINATTGDITEYQPGKAPEWLDRVFSSNLVSDIVSQWGLWSSSESRSQWPNWAGQFQMTPELPELVYNNSDIPVWLIPMRSHQASNASSTGVLLYDTRDNKGIFYPGLSGLGVGDNVTHTFQNAASNIRSYPIDAVQLYSINGVPTWVGVYTQAQGEHGQSFAAVGLVDARHLNGANVIMAADMNSALSRYASYLASGGGLTADEIASMAKLEKTVGQINRIGLSVELGESYYHILVGGQNQPFTATLKVSRLLPLMQVGDNVQIEYLGSNSDRAVTSIIDQELEALTQSAE